MSTASTQRTNEPTLSRPLRLWPGVAAAALLVAVRLGLPVVWPDGAVLGVIGAAALALVIVVWWVFFSRAAWSERLGGVLLMIVALAAAWFLVHESIRGGMMGRMLPVVGIPVLALALVVWAVAARRLSKGPRRAALLTSMVIACATLTLVRTGGISGEGMSDFHWRWTPTPEQRLLARTRDEPLPGAAAAPASVDTPAAPAPPPVSEKATGAAPSPPPPAAAAAPGADTHASRTSAASRVDWAGFRGPHRDGRLPGVRVGTEWSRQPPVELWRRPIGPGWSSFAVRGDLIYTQEQRGEGELVSCYRLGTGAPVWTHRDPVRFYESNGGAGPRGTPTVHNGRIYTVGATGIVNALDAATGAVIWSRNAATDTGAPLPGWGFTSSPLVVDDLVVVAASGRLVAYDVAGGNPRWFGPVGLGGSYSSPHLATIGGVPQVLLLRGGGASSFALADGTLLWEFAGEPGASIVQPALPRDGGVLIAPGDSMGGTGIRRLAVAHEAGPGQADKWTVVERWTSRGLKPYFNDFVVHKGYAYGFDGAILSSINLEDGARAWKGGRFGAGQLLLLADQDLLLVVSEEGELALVRATPDQFTEIARFKAIEGKTWNHPVLVGDVLLVRNGEEMAAFRMPLAGR